VSPEQDSENGSGTATKTGEKPRRTANVSGEEARLPTWRGGGGGGKG
jgi:hypothetical protein